MRYHVLASDYDGTLARDGVVDAQTVSWLEKLLATGRRLVLVTGRELPELLEIFPQLSLFERVVAENGALLYHPASRAVRALADPPPAKFVEALRRHGVSPLSVGNVIVATLEPHGKVVLDTIQDLGLEMQVIFNKRSVMVLPAGVNKASGLLVALKEMGLSAHNAIGVGDAENDHALLHLCEFSAAVANALPALKEVADFVAVADHGAGVSELIEKIVANDLKESESKLERHRIPIGTHNGDAVSLSPYGPAILIAGPGAVGRSSVAEVFLRGLGKQKYQFCVIDPNGVYENLEGALVLGGSKGPPTTEEVIRLLQNPDDNVVISLAGMANPARSLFFLELLPQIQEMKAKTGRPHWILIDEAHQLLPADWQPGKDEAADAWHNFLLSSTHAEMLAPALLAQVGTVIVAGGDASATLRTIAKAARIELPQFASQALQQGNVLAWFRAGTAEPIVVRTRV